MKLDINIKASQLGKSLQNLSKDIEANLQTAIKSVSRMAYSQGQIYAQQRLNRTRLQYLDSFHYQNLGKGIYLIYLDDEMDYLESGYGSYDMKPGMLNGPKSKPLKDGTGRYNTIPFSHKPTSKAPMSMAQQLLQDELGKVIKENKLSKTFRDASGRPLQGVVARIKGTDLPKNLAGLVKVQKTYAKKTESYYLTFRRVSSNSPPGSWIHPGYGGAKIFPDLESWTNRKIDEVLRVILK